MSTWYRIQEADYAADALLDTDNQKSHSWGGDDIRDGVSVCDSREALADYLVQAGIPFGAGDWNLIELEGDRAEGEGLDASLGECLVRPTRIISVESIVESFLDDVDAAYERMCA